VEICDGEERRGRKVCVYFFSFAEFSSLVRDGRSFICS